MSLPNHLPDQYFKILVSFCSCDVWKGKTDENKHLFNKD